MSSSTKWLWIDVETPGLGYDPDHPQTNLDEQILELAAIATDYDLNELATFGPVVVHAEKDVIDSMSDYVRQMHTDTGLLDKVQASTTTETDLDTALAQWLDERDMTSGLILCGNSLKLDFDFIRRRLPKTFSRLGYRTIDVSSFKEALRRWAPEVVAELEAAKNPNHKALDDIRWSIRELAFYRGHLGLGPKVDLGGASA